MVFGRPTHGQRLHASTFCYNLSLLESKRERERDGVGEGGERERGLWTEEMGQ